MTGTLHEDQYTCLIFRSFLLRMIMFQVKVVEKIKTHFIHRNTVYEIIR
jgi:hypothetical protein